MDHVTTGRRLVKSHPELWAELSDPESLARRLGELGEIRITRTLPETAVAWEAERATGIVEIEPSGWGTRVSLSASPTATPEPEPPPAPAALPPPSRVETEVRIVAEEERRIEIPAAPPEPTPAQDAPAPTRPLAAEAEPPPRSGVFGRWFRRRQAEPPSPPDAPPSPEPEPAPEAPPPPEVLSLRIVHAVCATRVPERPAPAPPPAAPAPAPDPAALHGDDLRAVLDRVLDDLGAAHHRPFSRG